MFICALDIAKQIAMNFKKGEERQKLLKLIAKLLEMDNFTSVQPSSK